MFNQETHGFCSEFYTVEKSIEVVVTLRDGQARVRLEALKDQRTARYSTASYIEHQLTLQPTYPQTNGCYDRHPEDFRIWVAYDLPWTDGHSADQVLASALSFLGERCAE